MGVRLVRIRRAHVDFAFVLFVALCFLPTISHATHYTRYVDAHVADIYKASAEPDCGTYDASTGQCEGGSGSSYKTTEDVNSFIKSLASDDSATIYFQRGDTWYITSPSAVLRITKQNVTFDAFGRGALPKFDGNDVSWDGTKRQWMLIVSAANVTVKNLELSEAYGDGVLLDQVSNSNITLSGLVISEIGYAAINFSRATHVTIEYCDISRSGLHSAAGPSTEPGVDDWPQAINVNTYGNSDNIIRYNKIYNIFGEGMGCRGSVCEYNIVGPTTAVGIYSGQGAPVIRYNLVWGNSDTTYAIHYMNGRKWVAGGIGSDCERASNSINGLRIYGNIVVGRGGGISIKNSQGEAGATSTNGLVYQNTLIDNGENFSVTHAAYSTYTVKNNLSVVYDTTYASHISLSGTPSTWTIGPNHWSSTPEYSDFKSEQDLIGDPMLPKTSGWTDLIGESSLRLADLYPYSSSLMPQAELREHHARVFNLFNRRATLGPPPRLRIRISSN